ncbi:MAG: hypothetical protein JEY91_08555 [Spirochaetaceae bacterium]|nr:hypothetical protein [Spirochaetaceae bacterium]
MKQTPIDEIYHFKCTSCGDCCSGHMEININIYDLYKISRKSNFSSTGELFERRLVKLVQVQNNCWTPQIIFKKLPLEFCPWLINDMGDNDILKGFCSLHPTTKPLICRMAPAGRVVDFHNHQISYVLTPPTENCHGMKSTQENRLSLLERDIHDELELEYRFYRILENLKKVKIPEDVMLKKFYIFNTDSPFEQILAEREKMPFNLML